MTRRVWSPRLARVGIVVFVAVSLAGLSAGQPLSAVSIDDDDIGGVVTGPNGPEAGVWVIAETTALPTRFSKVVVTDDNGRYLIPDLPDATYDVWVRGYGLVDSSKAHAAPGTTLNLTAVVAPTPQVAVHYYPAAYWFFLTITDAGVDTTQLRIAVGERIEIVNSSSRPHRIQSNPHPIHTECPPLNLPGQLEPGERGFTGAFTQEATCGFHDHLNPSGSTLQGEVMVGNAQGGSGDGGGGGGPYAVPRP